jgi:hypothetical protein
MALEIESTSIPTSITTHVEFILDETGSMNSCRQSTIDGFNEYVNGLKQDSNTRYELSLVKFDVHSSNTFRGAYIEQPSIKEDVRKVFTDRPINEVAPITQADYIPGGMTNLNDAIGVSITDLENRLGATKDKAVLVVILTDGEENASKEWTKDAVASLIKRKKKDGWTITFLGANIDVQTVGAAYSIEASNVKAYSTSNMAGTMRGLASATRAYAMNACVLGGSAATSDFFENTSDWTQPTKENNNE